MLRTSSFFNSLDPGKSAKKSPMNVDMDKENPDVKPNFGAIGQGTSSNPEVRPKLGCLSLNTLQANLGTLEEKFKKSSENVATSNKERFQGRKSMTKLKPRESRGILQQDDSLKDVPVPVNSASSISATHPEEPFISDFVSSVPKCDLLDDYPPLALSGYYNYMSVPTPPSPCSPYLPQTYQLPMYLPSPGPVVTDSLSTFSTAPSHHSGGVSASVEMAGFIRLRLNYDVILDLNTNMALRLQNQSKQSSMTISDSGKHSAIIHPKGRVLIYDPRVEIQTEDTQSVKNAKVYPRGISFTANNMALVYLLDEAGARSTSDMFHDLYATNIVDTLFEESCVKDGDNRAVIQESITQLDRAQYWRTDSQVDCWIFQDVFVQQTMDGLVIVERTLENGTRISMRASPSNGKIRLDSNFVQVTASLGDESHMFLRSKDRRLHYNGNTGVFIVRNAGHSAGFDEDGELRIF